MVDQNFDLDSCQILIVEDEAVTRTALTMLLDYQGAIVTAVDSMQSGIQAIESGLQPDLLISNIRLPDGNGAGVLAAIRSREGRSGPASIAIALTGERLESIRNDPEFAGFQMYLSKPYDPKVLLDTIARLMRD